MKVFIHFVHAIAPNAWDVGVFYMEDCWSSFEPRAWARALRDRGVLPGGASVREIRRDTDPASGLDRVVVFPRKGAGWHALKIVRLSAEVK